MNLRGMTRKGQVQGQVGLIVSMVVLIIVLAIGALVVDQTDNSFTAGSAAANASANGLTAFQNYSTLLPSAGTVAGAVLILSLVIGGLAAFALRR